MNALATVFLLVGYAKIKAGDRAGHGKAMGAAVVTSALFLALYLASKIHLWVVLGRTNVTYAPEPTSVWAGLKGLYLLILIPHVILAIVVTPFILRAVWLAKVGRLEEHKRLTRWVFPVWLYVSVTGVVVWAFMEFSGSLAAAAQAAAK